jgi:RHS repeat-associated protein
VDNGSEHELSSYRNVDYTYINDERLKQVSDGTNNYYMYYDALGRCVKRTRNGVTTYYIYDGEKPIIEYNSGGTLVGRNLYGKGVDEILMRAYGNQSYYFQQDRNGNVTHLTDASGAIVEKYKYDAFGKPTIYAPNGIERSTSACNNRFLFTGREYAATFGLYQYRARAYNPTLGRFMSEDPKLFDAGDYNLFRYVHNDPLDLTDPMGLEGGGRQPGDHPLPNPVATLPAPLGSNIPIRITIDAKLVEYANARGVNLGQGGSVQANFYVREGQMTLVNHSGGEALAVRMESGKEAATNVPEAEALKNEGPLPRGSYRILSRTQDGSQLYK